MSEQLPAELDTHVTGAVERDDALTVFVDSAAWAARLRYTLGDLAGALEGVSANIRQVRVKVLPRR